MSNASARAVYLEGSSDRALDAEMSFFEALRLPNGTYKTTAAGRLRDLDQAVAGLLPTGAPLRILDAGASSGITTLDWVASLEAAGHEVSVVLVDLAVEAEIVTPAPGLDLLFLGDGHLLQVTVGGRSRFRPVDGARLRSRLAGRVFSGIEAAFRRRSGTGVPVRLVSPRLARRSNVEVVQHDLMQPLRVGTFDVVRAANVVNLCYFDEGTVRGMVQNLVATLRPGGLLVVCRTIDGVNHGSVLRRDTGGRLRVEARVGQGSEIEGMLEGMGGRA